MAGKTVCGFLLFVAISCFAAAYLTYVKLDAYKKLEVSDEVIQAMKNLSHNDPRSKGFATVDMTQRYDPTVVENIVESDFNRILGFPQDHQPGALPDGSGSPDIIQLIDSEFYDKHLVDRKTGNWLAGDIKWVIGVTRWEDFNSELWKFGLVHRSILILNDYYKGDPNVRFGIIDTRQSEDLALTLYGSGDPRIYVLKDGMAHRDIPFGDTYTNVYKFIEGKYLGVQVYQKFKLQPRMTPVGVYWQYATRDVSNNIDQIDMFIANNFIDPYFSDNLKEWIAKHYFLLDVYDKAQIILKTLIGLLGVASLFSAIFTFIICKCLCRKGKKNNKVSRPVKNTKQKKE